MLLSKNDSKAEDTELIWRDGSVSEDKFFTETLCTRQIQLILDVANLKTRIKD